MALTPVRVTGKYLSTDGRSTVDPTKLSALPPVKLPGEQYVYPVPAKLKGGGEFLLPLFADSGAPLTYVLTETLGGSARTLSVTVSAGASGELALKDLTGYSQPAGAVLSTFGKASPGATLGTPPDVIYVASATATVDQKARAGVTYTCDGTADDVQIQAAVDALVAAGGGTVLLSPGRFTLAARVQLQGPGDKTVRRRIGLHGAGLGNTILRPANNLSSALHLSGGVQCDVGDFLIEVFGTTTGITSAAGTTNAAGRWALWLSTFRNIQVQGTFDGNSTGWGLNLDSPFRSVFENIEVVGTTNGLRLYSTDNAFNPGDCAFIRCFMTTYGVNGFGYKIESTVASGKMNQIEFILCEGYADGPAGGSGNTGIWLGGVGPVNYTKWHGTNLENYDTVFHVANGQGNTIDGNFWSVRPGVATNTLVRFDAAATDNRVTAISGHYTATAHRLITSTATRTDLPNRVENVGLVADTGGSVTNSISDPGAVLTRSITADGANAAGASGVAVKALPFTKVVHGATASVVRPNATYVLWEGSVQPTNWLDGDDWNQT